MSQTEAPRPGKAGLEPAEDNPTLRWALVVIMAAAFVIFSTVPALQGLKQSSTLFPVAIHTIFESFAILVSIMIFAVAYTAHDGDQRTGNSVILACGFLAVGLLDFAHTLSYRGMPDLITPSSEQKAIVFWLAARYVASLTLLAAVLRPWTAFRRPRTPPLLLAGSLVFVAAMFYLQIFRPEIFPTFFIPGQGLTSAKIRAEYSIVVILLVTLVALLFNANNIKTFDTSRLIASVLLTILSELCFTIYSNVYEIFSFLGHIYKASAYFFLYQAVFVSSVREPFRHLSAEIEERQAAESRAAFLAYHDSLTGLPNRILAQEYFVKAMAAADRNATKLALLFIDLDNFKTVNDTLGHSAGDQLLRGLADRLRSLVRKSDTVSRQGGDEFLLMLVDLPDAEATLPLIDKLTEQIRQPIMVGGREIISSISIGVAIYPDDGDDFDNLLQQADTAMYQAKEAGRGTYRFFTPAMVQGGSERLNLRAALSRALERNEFVLHYQPQIDLASKEVVGVEALLRWRRPGQGMEPAERFIKAAEECGVIVPIGRWVIETACRQLAEWRRAGWTDLTMAINLSAAQFLRGDLEKAVAGALERTGVPARCLDLELTESILLHDSEAALAIVQRLKALGVRLSIDDFGTGYSSLAYLSRFAVHKLKIDQSFIQALSQDSDQETVVRAIIQMGNGLGLRTIAEGVENAAIRDRLASLGCQEAQGYFIARPLPGSDVPAFCQNAQLMT